MRAQTFSELHYINQHSLLRKEKRFSIAAGWFPVKNQHASFERVANSIEQHRRSVDGMTYLIMPNDLDQLCLPHQFSIRVSPSYTIVPSPMPVVAEVHRLEGNAKLIASLNHENYIARTSRSDGASERIRIAVRILSIF